MHSFLLFMKRFWAVFIDNENTKLMNLNEITV